MKTGGSISLLFVGLALVLNAVPSCAQVGPTSTAAPGYKAGQVWKYKTASGVDDSTLVILKVDTDEKSNLIHIRIDGIPLPSCGGLRLTTSIEHLAVTEKALRKSTTQLLKDNVPLPDNSSPLTTNGKAIDIGKWLSVRCQKLRSPRRLER
jgi:hypothetical protein